MASGPVPGVRGGAGFEVRNLDSAELQQQAARLYRRVFGYQDPDVGLSPPLLTALLRNGGSVVGAVGRDGNLLGFAYGMRGGDGEHAYHYSQAAVVGPGSQGLGLGRELKLAQADVARGTGLRFMRWSYDPVLSRNAHFNLDVLGAIGRWFVDDFYLREHSDRVVVEWDLDVERDRGPAPDPVPAVGRTDWGRVWGDDQQAWLAVPADPGMLTGPAEDDEVRIAVRASFHELLDRGLVALSCSRSADDTSLYRFGPLPAGRADR